MIGPMSTVTRLVRSLAAASLPVAVLASPVFAQTAGGTSPGDTPGFTQVIDTVTAHIVKSRNALDQPYDPKAPSETPTRTGLEAYDLAAPELRHWLWIWACLVAAEDLEGILLAHGESLAGDDPKKRAELRDMMDDYRRARGSAEKRADAAAKARKRIEDLRARGVDVPRARALDHIVYHLASGKKIFAAHFVGLDDLAKPVKAWRRVRCAGEDCRLETDVERGEGLPQRE
jgi:hypothetical protein